jgi:hypothetical protein
LTIATNLGIPNVQVSSLEAYPNFQDPILMDHPSSQNLIFTLSVCSKNANAHNFQLTATSSTPLLTAYLDNDREDWTVQNLLLIDNQDVNHTLRIESSPQITAGTYQVFLNYSYQDNSLKSYSGFKTLTVNVGQVLPGGPTSDYLLIPVAVVVVVITAIAMAVILLRRKR